MTCSKYKNIHPGANFTPWSMAGFMGFFTRLSKTLLVRRHHRLSISAALNKGSRDSQEDVVLTASKYGSKLFICVLADGMGGHANGGTASGIVSQIVLKGLQKKLTLESSTREINDLLLEYTNKANQRIARHVKKTALANDMGTTLAAIVIKDSQLHWISIGDSPIFLFRKGKLVQLNEDHSMAPQIDEMVQMGIITQSSAENHLDRNRLTSALMGKKINRVDLPEVPTELYPKDIVVVCSDGLQFLSDQTIEKTIKLKAKASASVITDTLMDTVLALNSSTQDNIGICTAKYQSKEG